MGNSNVEIAKVVNTFANQAAKKILIGFDCCFGDLADAVKERLRAEYAAPLEGGGGAEGETGGGEARVVVEGACGFIDAVRFGGRGRSKGREGGREGRDGEGGVVLFD